MEKAIICVDDEKLILESLRSQLLPEYGNRFIFEFAESGEEGLAILNDFNTEDIKTIMIISDWLMPKMKGDEFLIKVHTKNPEIITVLLSGYADSEVTARSRECAGLFKFISKPWKKNELFSVIDEGID